MNDNQYVITERLTTEQIHVKVFELNKRYAGKRFKHVKSGGLYEVYGATVINASNGAEWGFIYRPIDEEGCVDLNILHTRPMFEFLDGRFVEVDI